MTNLHLGQLVEQMRDNRTVYGILSTYQYTVFVRRIQDCRFEMSKAISCTATHPSIRQCIMAIAILAAEAGDYTEPNDFDPRKVRQEVGLPAYNLVLTNFSHQLRTSTGHQASTRDSHYRLQSSSDSVAVHSGDTAQMPVTTETIFFGDNVVAMDSVEVTKTIRDTNTKKVFDVSWHGQPAVAKWWATSDVQRYQ